MTPYIIIILITLFIAISSKLAIGCINGRQICDKICLVEKLYIILSFISIFIITGFRGDFATDYNNYIMLFKSFNSYKFGELLNVNLHQEMGYILINRLIGVFTDNGIYLILIISFITIYCFYNQIIKYSKYPWISIILFITIGSLYTSFNIMRQILAVSIVFWASKYIYEDKFTKYVLGVILAASIHRTALIMLPFFFILKKRFNIKKFIIAIISLVIVFISLEHILRIVQLFLYSMYTEETYGMTGLKLTNIVLPVGILIFTLFHYNKLDKNDLFSNVLLNAVVFYTFFSILGLKVQMVQRVSEFFAPYSILIIPLIISKINDKKIKIIYMFLVIAICILYNYITLSGSGYDPYYFIWQ